MFRKSGNERGEISAMGVIDEVKDRIDVIEIVGETVKLRKSGKNYTGFCPFHPNTRTPSFAVFPESGTWRCFGACNEGGDVFSFVMKKEGWDFPETLRYLAERAGVELTPQTPDQEAQDDANDRLRELLEAASTVYRHNLMQSEAGKPALAYLRSRGMTDASLEAFGVGFALDSWDASTSHLQERGYQAQEQIDAGLASERDSGGIFDRFRGRIVFPIRDARGRMAGFGARTLDPEGVPKYLNSPQSVLFDKGRLLYGLDQARIAIRREDRAVIVEGYMDVIGLHQAGYENAVSPMGTALTEHQLRQLKRYSRRIILALDADAAGSQATLRGLDVARDTLDREAEPVFNSRGLVRYEGRLDADLRIVSLPEGLDPDEIVLDEPQAWPKLLEGAQTIVDYVLDVSVAGVDIEDPKGKAQVAQQVLPLIEDVANPVEREAYRQKLARRLKVDERSLQSWRRPSGRKVSPAGEDQAGEVVDIRAASDVAMVERFCLGVLLNEPGLLFRVDRAFQTLEMARPGKDDFSSAERQLIFASIREALSQDEVEAVGYWQESLPPALREAAQAFQELAGDLDSNLPRVIEEVLANFFRLRKRSLDASLTNLRFQLEALQEVAGEEYDRDAMWQVTRRVQELADQRERLDRALVRGPGTLSVPAST
jgi:DNA primase